MSAEALDPFTHGGAALIGGGISGLFIKWLIGRTLKEYDEFRQSAATKEDVDSLRKEIAELKDRVEKGETRVEADARTMQAQLARIAAQLAFLNGQLQARGIVHGPVYPPESEAT